MDFHSDDETDPTASFRDSQLERLKRQNYALQLKLRRQESEAADLRAQVYSSGEEQDPTTNNMGTGNTADALALLNITGSQPANAATPNPALERLDPTLVGMSPGLKHLYSGKEDRRGRYQWQTTVPKDVGKPAEDAETARWALIVRHVKVSIWMAVNDSLTHP